MRDRITTCRMTESNSPNGEAFPVAWKRSESVSGLATFIAKLILVPVIFSFAVTPIHL